MGGGHGQVEGQHLQEQVLHSQQLPLCVGVVRYVDKLVHLGRVDLFVLPVKGKGPEAATLGTCGPFLHRGRPSLGNHQLVQSGENNRNLFPEQEHESYRRTWYCLLGGVAETPSDQEF